jgi:hypothetical protein
MNVISFDEWLKNRDENLYSEISMSDIGSGIKKGYNVAKDAWKGAGKLVGKKARNATAAVLLGGSLLAHSMSGYSDDVNKVAAHNRITPAAAYQLQQDDPNLFKGLAAAAQAREKIHGLKAKLAGRETGGENWSIPSTHVDAPDYQGGGPTGGKQRTGDIISQIDSILGNK